MNSLLANYEQERQAFKALIQPDSQNRILLFRGESGSGKTTLIAACLEEVQEDSYVGIQFRGSAVGVAEIFDRVGDRIGWKRMSTFIDQVAALQGVPVVQVERNWQAGSNNQITVALSAKDPMDRDERRVCLTKAWFEDLRKLPHHLLLVLDTFEQATTEVSQWVEGPFLARAARVDTLRVLLAGQTVPEINNIEWGRYCEACNLFGVQEAYHWMPVVRAMNRYIPFGDPLTWLAGVCHALDGHPHKIKNLIEGLPRKMPA